jgi:RND superfamily putative drug exporter
VKLLGHWNWYLPKWLEWLPHLEYDGPTEKVEASPVLGPTG